MIDLRPKAGIGFSVLAALIAMSAALPASAERISTRAVDGVTGKNQTALRQRLAAKLFGETVGEVRLTLVEHGDEATLLYRSDLTVVRDAVRLRQKTLLESRFHPRSGALIHTHGRRCTGEEDGGNAASCVDAPPMTAQDAPGLVPALAAELVLSRWSTTPHPVCIDVVDEISGHRGSACAAIRKGENGTVELKGEKLGQAFRARVRNGLLIAFEAPGQGAAFTAATGPVVRSGADLFADPVSSSGNVSTGLRRGVLTLRVEAPTEVLQKIEANAPGHRVILQDDDSVLLELRQAAAPRSTKAAQQLAHAALLVAKARGHHLDCQAATDWFVVQAQKRGWKVEPVVGVAWVYGRFAFHSWALIEVDGHRIPVDPLLAQVPADAGHLQLGSSAGAVFLAARRAMRIAVVSSVSATTE